MKSFVVLLITLETVENTNIDRDPSRTREWTISSPETPTLVAHRFGY